MAISTLRRLYIAGPMSGKKDHNFGAFDEAAVALRKAGYEVVSPAETARALPGAPGSLPYEVYARESLRAMLDCTDLVLLNGWRGSRGAMNELNVADFLKFKVWSLGAQGQLHRLEYGDRSV